METSEKEPAAADPYDSAWKYAFDGFLPQMMQMLFPAAWEEIDWSVAPVSLNSELRSLFGGEKPSELRADGLYQVARVDGRQQWLVVHVEVQSTADKDLARRMFAYLCRCFEKYGSEVLGFAVLGDLRPSYRPEPFLWKLGKSRLLYEFDTAKLLDFRDRLPELEVSDNPFAMVVLAHLYTKWTRKEPDRRRQFKLRLARLLFQRNWDRERIHRLFAVIDSMMRLRPEQEIIYQQEVLALREETKMAPYTSTLDILRGAGRHEGRHEGAEQVLRSQLVRRFGDLPAWVNEKLAAANVEAIELWALSLLDARSLDEVFA
jgi:hypothetical protein